MLASNFEPERADQMSACSVAKSCPTLHDPMDCSRPSSSVHGVLQARTLEWVANSFSRGSSRSRDPTSVSCTVGRFFTIWATREASSDLKPHKFWSSSVGRKSGLASWVHPFWIPQDQDQGVCWFRLFSGCSECISFSSFSCVMAIASHSSPLDHTLQ